VDSPEHPDGAAPGSLSAIAASLLALVHTRVELFGVELREEALRAPRLRRMAAAAVLFLGAALVLLALVVAQLFADTHPLAALAGMTILYVAIAAWLFVRMRETVARGPAPFAATLRELDEDVGALKDGDG
jgi:uncharacterized membrane protein YqjE